MKKVPIQNYKILLFDADGTLVDFHKAETQAVSRVLEKYGIEPEPRIIEKYSAVNASLWKLLELKQIRREDIMNRRFKETFAFFGLPYSEEFGIEAEYERLLAEGHDLLEHAREVCETLSKTHRLYILTNGGTYTQTRRIQDCGLLPYLDGVFISGEMGVTKPSKEFFDIVFERIGVAANEKESVLMIGDSYSSDILGAMNAGIDSCWYNPAGEPLGERNAPTYEIRDLRVLLPGI